MMAFFIAMLVFGVANAAITANAGGDKQACAGDYKLFFDGSLSTGVIDKYTWDFGDTTPAFSGKVARHAYSATGDYTATLTVQNTTLGQTSTDTLIVHVVAVPTSGCNWCGAFMELSKTVACPSDTVLAYVTGLSNCFNKSVYVTLKDSTGTNRYSGKCDNALDNSAGCVVNVPSAMPSGVGRVTVTIMDGATKILEISSDIRINTANQVGSCYDSNGAFYYCYDSCNNRQPERLWEEVAAVSLPMHFSFAMQNNENTIPSSVPAPACNTTSTPTTTYGLVDYGISCAGQINCSCNNCSTSNCLVATDISRWMFGASAPPYYKCDITKACDAANAYYQLLPPTCTECQYDTHRIYRYVYNWVFSYDMATFISNEKEPVPMVLGYNQTTSVGSEISGSCDNDNLCYADVPLCGDGVCDTEGGERCWNCEKDCGASADDKNERFTGKCGDIGCSICPITPGFSDARSCIIERRQEGEDCNCNVDMCDKSNPSSAIGGDGAALTCNYENIAGERMSMGKCCHENEHWNGTHCVVKRQLVAEPEIIGLDVREDKWVTSTCCGGNAFLESALSWATGTDLVPEDKLGFLKIKYKIHNLGDDDELYTSSVYIATSSGAIATQEGTLFRGQSVYHKQGKADEIYLACASFKKDLCPSGDLWGYINSTGQYDADTSGNDYPMISIDIEPKYATDYNTKYNGHNYPSVLKIEDINCSTLPDDSTQLVCSNGDIFATEGMAGDFVTGLCGGFPPSSYPSVLYSSGWVLTPSMGFAGCWSLHKDTFCLFNPLAYLTYGQTMCFVNCNYGGGCP